MALQADSAIDSVVQWAKGETANGAAYEYGPSESTEEKDDSESKNNADSFSSSVSTKWQVMYNLAPREWIEASQEVKNFGISKYRLHPTSPQNTDFQYMLEFVNTKGWGFSFTDETGDTYFVATIRNGMHGVQYSSEKPTIVKIS